MRIHNSPVRKASGFSLIEVMIAVVVLAVGLLALVALQTSLVREGADARARSRIAALVSSRMDEARAGGYGGLATVGAAGCVSGNDVCQAQAEAAVNGLQVGQVVLTVPGSNSAEYKTLTVNAGWTDSGGTARTLSMSTVISPLALDGSGTLVNQQQAGDVAKMPVVRTTNPATPGMIPVAVSATDSTAATNPRLEWLSKGKETAVIGTKFDVLTYTNESATTARIQRRVETTVIKCTCQYGAGGNKLPEIYQQAQWPAIWTGERYDIFKPQSASVAPAGAAAGAGPLPGATQSELCTDCCRDHHDADSASGAKFDPERVKQSDESLVHSHYNRDSKDNLVIVSRESGGVYEEACRMIRVDGMWRTAADMYNRYSGLLATSTASGKTDPATSGVPTTTAADIYGGNRDKSINGFVKDVLAAYRSNGWRMDLNQASALYETAGLNNPAEITIRRPTTSPDERYLHLRGLYVDMLNKSALDRIAKAVKPENCRSSSTFECVLPYLPFTTINLTEIGFWKPQVKSADEFQDNKTILSVASGSSKTFNAHEPFRGRTNAMSTSNNNDVAYAVASITRSNSGVAIMPEGIDPEDDRVWSLETNEATVDRWVTDRQQFRVSASTTTAPAGQSFFVALNGLPHTADKNTFNNPPVSWYVDGAANSCLETVDNKKDYDPNNYACNTTKALGVAGQIGVMKYGQEEVEDISITANCSYEGSTVSVTGIVGRPFYRNFQPTSATIGGVAGTISVSSDGKSSEAATISFAIIPADAIASVAFTEQAKVVATLASCTASKSKSGRYSFRTVTWNEPWKQ